MQKMFSSKRIDTLLYWIKEREAMRIQKEELRLPKPWTKDPLMANARFCNVRRMDDKVSRWLMDKFYVNKPYEPKDAVVAATLARLINWPDTLEYLYPLGWPNHWDSMEASNVKQALTKRKQAGQKVFTGVYIINSATYTPEDCESGAIKVSVVVRTVNHVYTMSELLVDTNSMYSTHQRLMTVPGIGSFIAGQIVADLRHIVDGAWLDSMTWAPRGPGSMRGMAWLMGTDNGPSEKEFQKGIQVLMEIVKQKLPDIAFKLEAHDIQNCLCELSKYVRLQTGGRAKNHYDGGFI